MGQQHEQPPQSAPSRAHRTQPSWGEATSWQAATAEALGRAPNTGPNEAEAGRTDRYGSVNRGEEGRVRPSVRQYAQNSRPKSISLATTDTMNYPAWTNAQSLRLLEEFKKQECLWDPKNSFFFNATLKEAAWDDLSQIIGHRKAECKRKMESLKGSFRRERSRANRAKKGIGAPFTSKWFAFETMKFLEEREDFRTCYSNPPPEQFGEIRLVGDTQQFVQYTLQDINEKDPHWENKTHESDVDLDDDDDTPIDCEPFSVVDVDDPLPESEEKYSHTGPCSEVQNIPKSVINPSSPSDSPQAETFSVTTSHSPRREEKSLGCTCQDEYATYGQHVANKLRKLDDRSRAFVQHKINTLLYKAEIKMLGGDECI